MSIAIGNGESRCNVNIDSFNEITVGCNAIVRDYFVDHLVCCDKRMVREALEYNHPQIYTRSNWYKDFRSSEVKCLPSLPYNGNKREDDPWHWGSGPYAVLLASLLDNKVKLIGFDLYSNNKLMNNVYKGTENYKKETDLAVDPRYWIYQISKIFQLFPKHKFTVYQVDDWQVPESWMEPNVSLDKISNISYNT
jgi:hypothetical protein